MSIVSIPCYQLAPHPLLARVSMLPALQEREQRLGNKDGSKRESHKEKAAELGEDITSLIESIKCHGVREPLKVVADGDGFLVADGRHRLYAAKAAGLDAVPCVAIDEADVTNVVLDAVNRRHMSKSARAYLGVLCHPEVATGAEARQKAGKKAPSAQNAEGLKGNSAQNAEFFTTEKLAQKVGVSSRLIDEAVWLYKAFQEKKSLRDKWEPSVWVSSLSSVRAGVLSPTSNPAEADDEDEQAKLKRAQLEARRNAERVCKALSDSKKHLQKWETLDEVQQLKVTQYAEQFAANLPEPVRDAMRKALNS